MKTWNDTSVCYFQKKGSGFGDYTVMDTYVDNILHTNDYDTLIVLFTWHEATLVGTTKVYTYYDGVKRERLRSIPIVITILPDSQWNYTCNANFTRSYCSTVDERSVFIMQRSLKRDIIRAGYFKKNKTPDPRFWSRLFDNNDPFYYPKPPWYLRWMEE